MDDIYYNPTIRKWCKLCPICNKEQSYFKRNTALYSLKKNIKCKWCYGSIKGGHLSTGTKIKLSISKLGEKNPNFGKKHTEEFKKYLREINLGSKNGFFGHHWNEEKKEYFRRINKGKSPPNKGKMMSVEQKIKLRKSVISNINGPNGSEIRRKMRLGALKRLEKLKISACEDENSREYFQWLNMFYGFDFKPKTFMEIGYVADGYDEKNHIWIEFDTPYHNIPSQKQKDNIREENIIKYFQKNNNPLNSFIRISCDKNKKLSVNKILCYG